MSLKREDDFNAQLSGSIPEPDTTSHSWFKRRTKGISTSTAEKKEVPDGLWTQCPSCKYTCTAVELKENLSICPKCNYHHRIGSAEYFEILFDDKEFVEAVNKSIKKSA